MLKKKIEKNVIFTLAVLVFLYPVLGICSESTLRFSIRKSDFEIHYEKGKGPVAQRVGQIVKKYTPILLDYFGGSIQSTVHISLNGQAEASNGFARVFPRNLIELNLFPPTGRDSLTSAGNWFESLIFHELVHIVHMDKTSGFPGFVRTIFGATGKWGGIAPRWFSEGIAVWAESHFIDGGRLRDPRIREVIRSQMKSQDHCQNIDCLDMPGFWPHGHSAYWVGGAFMDFLERTKPGPIKCLVDENSNNLPFFLGDELVECTGDDVKANFMRFKNTFIGKKATPIKFPRIWEAGQVVSQDSVIEVRWSPQRMQQRLIKISRKTGKIIDEMKLRGPVDQIRSAGDRGEFFSLVSMNWDGRPGRVQRWFRINDFKLVRKMSLEKNFYLFFDDLKGKKIQLGMSEQKWILVYGKKKFKLDIDMEWGIYDIQRRRRSLEWVVRKRNRVERYSFQFDSQKLRKKSWTLPQDVGPLRICDQGFLAFAGEKVFKGANSGRVRVRNKSQIYDLDSSGPHLIVFQKNKRRPTYYSKKSCRDVVGRFTRPADLKKVSKTRSLGKKSIQSQSYPRLSHFLPTYWLFSYGQSGNLGFWGGQTEFQDPLGVHTLNLGLNYMSETAQLGRDISYTYSRGQFFTTGFHSKTYSRTSLSPVVQVSESNGVAGGLNKSWGRWTLGQTYSFSEISTNDFLSSRRGQIYSADWVGSYQAAPYHQGLVSSSLLLGGRYTDLNRKDNFFTVRGRLMASWLFNPRNQLAFRTAYTHQLKEKFIEGIVFGGGASDFIQGQLFHEFYGAFFGDVYGNEVLTSRLQWKYNFSRVYRGWRSRPFFPLYRKQWRFLLGAETARSDRAILGNRFYRGSEIYSAHTGVSLLSQLFYMIPSRFDFIVAQNLNQGEDQLMHLLIHLNLDL